MHVYANIETQNTAIFQLSKDTFFDIVTKDQKLVKHILKLLVDDVGSLDPPIKYLDFVRPPHVKLKWPGKAAQEMDSKQLT